MGCALPISLFVYHRITKPHLTRCHIRGSAEELAVDIHVLHDGEIQSNSCKLARQNIVGSKMNKGFKKLRESRVFCFDFDFNKKYLFVRFQIYVHPLIINTFSYYVVDLKQSIVPYLLRDIKRQNFLTKCGFVTRYLMSRHRSLSALAQVMACCLTASNHYLNHYWPIIEWIL